MSLSVQKDLFVAERNNLFLSRSYLNIIYLFNQREYVPLM